MESKIQEIKNLIEDKTPTHDELELLDDLCDTVRDIHETPEVIFKREAIKQLEIIPSIQKYVTPVCVFIFIMSILTFGFMLPPLTHGVIVKEVDNNVSRNVLRCPDYSILIFLFYSFLIPSIIALGYLWYQLYGICKLLGLHIDDIIKLRFN